MKPIKEIGGTIFLFFCVLTVVIGLGGALVGTLVFIGVYQWMKKHGDKSYIKAGG